MKKYIKFLNLVMNQKMYTRKATERVTSMQVRKTVRLNVKKAPINENRSNHPKKKPGGNKIRNFRSLGLKMSINCDHQHIKIHRLFPVMIKFVGYQKYGMLY